MHLLLVSCPCFKKLTLFNVYVCDACSFMICWIFLSLMGFHQKRIHTFSMVTLWIGVHFQWRSFSHYLLLSACVHQVKPLCFFYSQFSVVAFSVRLLLLHVAILCILDFNSWFPHLKITTSSYFCNSLKLLATHI